MKRATITSVIFLFLMCVPSAVVRADSERARILLGSREAVLAPSAIYDGSRVLAPIGILDSLGATRASSQDSPKVTLIPASGHAGEVESVDVDGTKMLPMDKVMEIVGGEAEWNSSTHTLTLTAKLKSVEFVDDALKINCTFPVAYTAGAWGGKMWVDVAGTKLATDTKEVFIGASGVERARMAQFERSTARVALDLRKDLGYRVESKPVASQIVLKVGANLPNSAAVQPSKPKAQDEQAKTFKINEVRVETVDDNQFNLVISTSGRGSASADFGVMPPAITLFMPGGSLAVGAGEIENSHPLLKQYKFSRTDKGVRLELDLGRILAYGARVDNNTITLTARVPDKGFGQLSGKFIVVDPGHGGSQKGAQASGTLEKDVNLRIAGEVVSALQREGAKILLTRSGDDTLGLAARSEVAIYNKADFFISFHCNSNGVSNSATGIETYYHMQEGSPKALAYAIHAGVCAYTGMCDRRPRSDRALYASGLAVLRRLEGSNIPGVLVECGYLNSGPDRAKLLDAGYRKKLAEGVVAGLKAYVEGTPIQFEASE